MTAMTEADQAERERRVAKSRAEQGLPPTVTDPTVLRTVADIFCAEGTAEPAPATPRARRARHA